MSACPLCRLVRGNIVTTCHHQNELLLIVDCKTCRIPMCIVREQTGKPDEATINAMKNKARQLFGGDIKFRGPCSVKKHYHLHVIKRWLHDKRQLC